MMDHGTQVLKLLRAIDAPQSHPHSSAKDNGTGHRQASGGCQFLCRVGISTVYHGDGVLCHSIDGDLSYHMHLVGGFYRLIFCALHTGFIFTIARDFPYSITCIRIGSEIKDDAINQIMQSTGT